MARSPVHALCHGPLAREDRARGYGPCVLRTMLLLEMVIWLTLGALEGLLLYYVTAAAYARRPWSLFVASAGAGLLGGLVHRMAGDRSLAAVDPDSILVAGITSMIAALTWHVLTIHVPMREHRGRRPTP